MKRIFIFVVVLLLLPLSGCGIVSIGYNYGDVYLRYTINSYATFSSEQQEIIRKEVDEYMLWHRKNMLPEYVSFLQQLKRDAESGKEVTAQDVTKYRSELRALYVKTVQPTVHPAAKLLLKLEPEQLQELVKSFAKENSKRKEKELAANLDEFLSKRAERTIDFLENLLGDFSATQLETIKGMSYKLPYATSIYIQLREDNQARLIEMLKDKSNEESLANFLSLWLLFPEKFRIPEEQALLKEYENATDVMIADIYGMLTERQRSKLVLSLDKYIDSFESLSK